MAVEIIWTKRAEKGFNSIIEYLVENWTEREIETFVKQSFHFFDLLSEHPELLQKSDKKNIYRGAMDNHNILTYRFKPRKKQIELVNIRPAKRRPIE